MENSRGSLWRRWDLHIHTPGTKKNDNYAGSTPDEKWSRFYSDVSDYIGDGTVPEKAVAAVAITDYLSVENYEKIIKDNRFPDSIALVLPNVEIRVQPVARDTPVNLHFIFDPSIVGSLESRFFSKLIFTYGPSEKFSATHSELIRLGKTLDPGLSEAAAYSKGIDMFIPSLDAVMSVFNSDSELRAATLIGVSNNSSDGASGVTSHLSYLGNEGSQLWGVRQAIYRFVDFIFSGNPSDRSYFLGESCDPISEVIRKCRSLKPCLHGCDAHENAKIFEPDEAKYCWIKADLTFNGLRQVLYEPKDRVRIGPIKPETKSDYQVIDSVIIQDQNFAPTPILFNDKLTCIIGGKSTGKSILLHNIARTIDSKQALSKIEDASSKTYTVDQMQVFWADGAVDSVSNSSGHKIVYIPQTYLNRLSDKNEEKTEIDSIIEEIVLSDPRAIAAHNTLEKTIKGLKTEADKRIYDLTTACAELRQLQEQAKEIGTRSGIEKEIEKYKQQKGLLSQGNNLTDEEIEQYEEAIKALFLLSDQAKALQDSKSAISNLSSIVEVVHPEVAGDDAFLEAIYKAEEQVKQIADQEWEKQKTILLSMLREKESNISTAQEHNTSIQKTYQERIESNEALHQLSKQLTDEELRLKKLTAVEEQIAEIKQSIDAYLSLLAILFESIEAEYKKYAEAVDINDPTGALEFSVSYPFKTVAFSDRIKSLFDNRTLKARLDIIDIENFDYNTFPPEKLKNLLSACITAELPLARGYNEENALRTILDDWFNISYNVKMDGDQIEAMSPGKKALVLLRLLINLADSRSPILIDQPEDDLDNRSITEDLIKFIKQKKVDRQIIVVTHNANVVLGADAEEVIVANRDGINSKNETFRFEYRSGAIEENEPVYDEHGAIRQGVLSSVGISQHICSILEGGEAAFNLRKSKYRI